MVVSGPRARDRARGSECAELGGRAVTRRGWSPRDTATDPYYKYPPRVAGWPIELDSLTFVTFAKNAFYGIHDASFQERDDEERKHVYV